MNHRTVARMLSNHQRRFVVGMVDGVRPYYQRVETGEQMTRASLFDRDLLRFCTASGNNAYNTSPWFCLTEDGRNVLAFVLAEYADALVAAEAARFELFKSRLRIVGYGVMKEIADDSLAEA